MNFNEMNLIDRFNNEVLEIYGNLVNRVSPFAHKWAEGVVPDVVPHVVFSIKALTETVESAFMTFAPQVSIELIEFSL